MLRAQHQCALRSVALIYGTHTHNCASAAAAEDVPNMPCCDVTRRIDGSAGAGGGAYHSFGILVAS